MTRHLPRLGLLLSLLFNLLLPLGCGPEDPTLPEPPDGGESLKFRWALVVSPPAGSELSRYTQRFSEFSTPPEGGLQIRLPQSRAFDLRVLQTDGRLVASKLSFYDQSHIAGHQLVASLYVSANGQNNSLRLPETDLNVLIRPSDPALPDIDAGRVTLERGSPNTLDFTIPSQFRVLHGRVHSALSEGEARSAVTVRAVGRDSGLKSTESITDSDGRFRLLLPQSADTVFILSAIPPASEAPTWAFEAPIPAPTALDTEMNIPLEDVSSQRKGEITLQVVGFQPRADSLPVEGAEVTLTATVAGLKAGPQHRLRGSTDKDGRVLLSGSNQTQLPLLAAIYQVKVTPPPNSHFEPYQSRLDLRELSPGAAESHQLVLPLRHKMTGQWRLADQSPLAEAWFSIYPLDPSHENPSAVDVATQADGRFQAYLDPGRYLVVLPAASTKHAVALFEFQMPKADFQAPSATLQNGERWQGQIAAGTPETLSKTHVAVFLELRGRTLELSQSQVDATGRFELYLPRGLEALVKPTRPE